MAVSGIAIKMVEALRPREDRRGIFHDVIVQFVKLVSNVLEI